MSPAVGTYIVTSGSGAERWGAEGRGGEAWRRGKDRVGQGWMGEERREEGRQEK